MSAHSSKYLNVLFGQDFLQHLSTLNVLLIGVGGIGCELLKTLSPFKFNKLVILDLDKIEVSNLNRQFLFRHHHVGRSKAEVAHETISNMFPHMRIESHHANIFEPQYAITFFKNFHIVFMALDNAEARSYVNKVCMILDLPLLEAGTTGHKGQAMLIKKGSSRCYNCYPKPKAKTYPVCTIRTFPEKPIHCIIWGKHLFSLLFGPEEKENPLIDLIDSLAIAEQDDLKLAGGIFNEIFSNQITKVKDIEPEKFKSLRPLKLEEADLTNIPELASHKVSSQTDDIKASIEIFLNTFKLLRATKAKEGVIMFDKDDNLAMKFVSAISNIRAYVFNIQPSSEFTIKEMAGNIVPTIASTNAIVAAIEVTEAIKFLQNHYLASKGNTAPQVAKNKELYVQNTRTTKVLEAALGKASNECFICNDNFLPNLVFTNFDNTLKDFLHHIQEKDESLKEFRITNSNAEEIYETSPDLDDDEDEKERNENNANKTLAHWFGNFQGEIVLNNDSNGNIEKYLLSNDSSLEAKMFNFTKRHQDTSKPSQLNEKMITKMADDQAKEIAANKVKAYSKAKEKESEEVVLEGEETKMKDIPTKENKDKNGSMIVLEDEAEDEDEIMFMEPKQNGSIATEETILGKRNLDSTEEGDQLQKEPGKKVKTDD